MKYKLGEICKIVSGTTPKTSIAEYWDGDIKWLTPAEIKDDSYTIYDTVRKITLLGKEKSGLNLFPKGTVILSSRAPIGKVAIAGCDMCCNQGFKNLICSETVYNKYLYWFLKNKKDYLNSLGRGATFKELSKQIVSEIIINLPSYNEQEKIVDKLERLQKIVATRKHQLLQLDKLTKSLFVEMFGDTVINPLGWEEHKLEEYIDFLTSGSRGWAKYFVNEENELFLTIKNVKNNKIVLDDIQYIKAPKNKEAERTKVKCGDLLISITADLGRTGVIDKDISSRGAYINQHLSLVRLDQNRINPQYISYYLETDAGKRQFCSKNQNGVKAGLNFDAIKSLNIIVPPIELQDDFVKNIYFIDKHKSVIQKSLDETQLLFDSLMQKYFG